jgi:hypothetical protein
MTMCNHRQIDISLFSQPIPEGAVMHLRVMCKKCGMPFVFRGPRVDETGQVLFAALTMLDRATPERVQAFLPKGCQN